jgi:hypothetical protein
VIAFIAKFKIVKTNIIIKRKLIAENSMLSFKLSKVSEIKRGTNAPAIEDSPIVKPMIKMDNL